MSLVDFLTNSEKQDIIFWIVIVVLTVFVLSRFFSKVKIGNNEIEVNHTFGLSSMFKWLFSRKGKEIETRRQDSLPIQKISEYSFDRCEEFLQKKQRLYSELFEEQFSVFKSKIEPVYSEIKESYLLKTKRNNDEKYVALFSYWYTDVVKRHTGDEIATLLRKNHLKFRKTEENEDTISTLIEHTFGKFIYDVENSPRYIEDVDVLKKVVNERKQLFANAITNSLQISKEKSEAVYKNVDELEKLTHNECVQMLSEMGDE